MAGANVTVETMVEDLIGPLVDVSDATSPENVEAVTEWASDIAREVINILQENGCKFNSLYFSTIMRITGKDHKIKFGRYNFKGINYIPIV